MDDCRARAPKRSEKVCDANDRIGIVARNALCFQDVEGFLDVNDYQRRRFQINGLQVFSPNPADVACCSGRDLRRRAIG